MSKHWIRCDVDIRLNQDSLDNSTDVMRYATDSIWSAARARVSSNCLFEGNNLVSTGFVTRAFLFEHRYRMLFNTLGHCMERGEEVALSGGLQVSVSKRFNTSRMGEVLYKEPFEDIPREASWLGVHSYTNIWDSLRKAVDVYRSRG